jgi:hypothetical protein
MTNPEKLKRLADNRKEVLIAQAFLLGLPIAAEDEVLVRFNNFFANENAIQARVDAFLKREREKEQKEFEAFIALVREENARIEADDPDIAALNKTATDSPGLAVVSFSGIITNNIPEKVKDTCFASFNDVNKIAAELARHSDLEYFKKAYEEVVAKHTTNQNREVVNSILKNISGDNKKNATGEGNSNNSANNKLENLHKLLQKMQTARQVEIFKVKSSDGNTYYSCNAFAKKFAPNINVCLEASGVALNEYLSQYKNEGISDIKSKHNEADRIASDKEDSIIKAALAESNKDKILPEAQKFNDYNGNLEKSKSKPKDLKEKMELAKQAVINAENGKKYTNPWSKAAKSSSLSIIAEAIIDFAEATRLWSLEKSKLSPEVTAAKLAQLEAALAYAAYNAELKKIKQQIQELEKESEMLGKLQQVTEKIEKAKQTNPTYIGRDAYENEIAKYQKDITDTEAAIQKMQASGSTQSTEYVTANDTLQKLEEELKETCAREANIHKPIIIQLMTAAKKGIETTEKSLTEAEQRLAAAKEHGLDTINLATYKTLAAGVADAKREFNVASATYAMRAAQYEKDITEYNHTQHSGNQEEKLVLKNKHQIAEANFQIATSELLVLTNDAKYNKAHKAAAAAQQDIPKIQQEIAAKQASLNTAKAEVDKLRQDIKVPITVLKKSKATNSNVTAADKQQAVNERKLILAKLLGAKEKLRQAKTELAAAQQKLTAAQTLLPQLQAAAKQTQKDLLTAKAELAVADCKKVILELEQAEAPDQIKIDAAKERLAHLGKLVTDAQAGNLSATAIPQRTENKYTRQADREAATAPLQKELAELTAKYKEKFKKIDVPNNLLRAQEEIKTKRAEIAEDIERYEGTPAKDNQLATPGLIDQLKNYATATDAHYRNTLTHSVANGAKYDGVYGLTSAAIKSDNAASRQRIVEENARESRSALKGPSAAPGGSGPSVAEQQYAQQQAQQAAASNPLAR